VVEVDDYPMAVVSFQVVVGNSYFSFRKRGLSRHFVHMDCSFVQQAVHITLEQFESDLEQFTM